jgi:hypothetical protein
LLPLDEIKAMDSKKLTKHKKIYQLQNVSDGLYRLSLLKMLFYNGNYNQYLMLNRIMLCYIVEENDVLLKEVFGSFIKTYTIGEDGLLKLHSGPSITKK